MDNIDFDKIHCDPQCKYLVSIETTISCHCAKYSKDLLFYDWVLKCNECVEDGKND